MKRMLFAGASGFFSCMLSIVLLYSVFRSKNDKKIDKFDTEQTFVSMRKKATDRFRKSGSYVKGLYTRPKKPTVKIFEQTA